MQLQPGVRNDLTDVTGLRVGAAADERAVSGTSVILAEAPAPCAFVRFGGGPGTRETDLLDLDALVGEIDALVLSGGSVHGLEAASAVTTALAASGRGVRLVPDVPPAPLVPAAILYDLSNGGEKAWGSHPPYGDLGRRALEEAEAGKPMHLGAAGAGYGARAGAHSGGLGAASWQLEGGGHLAALVALNSFGSPFMPGTQIPWAAPFAVGDEMGDVAGAPFARALGWPDDTKTGGAEARANTSLVAVATDIALTRADLQRVAWMAAAGLARAVRPVFAPYDGDVVFALSTAVHAPPEGGALSIARLGNLAADAVARAAGRAAVLGSSRGV